MVINNDQHQSTDQGNQFNSNSNVTDCELKVKRTECEVRGTREKEKAGGDDGRSTNNDHPLPLLPEKDDCECYMKFRECQFGMKCKFNHPLERIYQVDDVEGEEQEAYRGEDLKKNQCKVPDTQTSTLNMMAKPFEPNQQLAKVEEFPQRPGELECELYLKTGECRLKSQCRFHHPKGFETKVIIGSGCSFTEKGLPLRPGAQICPIFQMFGLCKYGPRCRFDHPSLPEIPSIAKPLASQPSSSANVD